MTKTEKFLENVASTIHERGSLWGHPFYNHKRISELWSAYLDHPITASQVAICMALLKISRLSESPKSEDSLLDAIAYLSIFKTVLEAEADINFTWGDD